MSELEVRVVEHGSLEYWNAVDLRRRVLRAPLGLDFSDEDLADEADQLHLAGFQEGRLIACAVLVWLTPQTAKMRQVAVEPDLQRKGLGSVLVGEFERIAAENGAGEIVLNARDQAIAFYERLGYVCDSDWFEEVSIPHRKMRKRLIPTA